MIRRMWALGGALLLATFGAVALVAPAAQAAPVQKQLVAAFAQNGCVDVNTADSEELRQLRHIDENRAGQILDLRPFTSVDDLDRVSGLLAGGPRLAELVEGGGVNDAPPLCPIAAADTDSDDPAEDTTGYAEDELPLTGPAAPVLVGAGLLLAAGGATAAAVGGRRALNRYRFVAR